jgi:hypothetical protein
MLHGFFLEKYQQKAVQIKLIPAINGSLLTFIPTIEPDVCFQNLDQMLFRIS